VISKNAILDAISDKRASDIFRSIALANSNSDILITQLKLTRKQYYSRMSSLKKAGLVKRQKGRYLLTSFGKVISSAYMNLEAKIDNALSSYWKLKAIDSMDLSLGQERNKVISVLIDNQEIESILMKEELQSSTQPASSRTQNRHDTLVTVPNLL
jgi:predicted transcriptional regulator